MKGLLAQWKQARQTRLKLRWVDPELTRGEWQVSAGVAYCPKDGTHPDAYQKRLLRSAGQGYAGRKRGLQAGGAAGTCDTLIARSDWTLLVDRERRWMLRVTDRPGQVDRLLRHAQWLARSYPCPEIHQATVEIPGAFAVRESFVDGVPVRDADEAQWDPVYRQLLASCEHHVEHCEGSFDLDRVWSEVRRWNLPGWLRRALDQYETGVEHVLREAPLLECHGDCHNGNVFVRPDGRVVLIDLERVQPLPFFYDALSLLRGTAPVNAALRTNYLRGDYDTEMASLWHAAGREWCPEHRVASLLSMALAHAFRPQFASAASHKRRDKFVGASEKLRSALRVD
ncbi:phosphotransferase [Thioalkalivibrio sp. ALJ9]|uniref:phosphotransferase n=1 Tax=Thioalkalivibrio sp. ALJ9 TaxID=1158758 RepID=UPI00039FA92E|nr:phosphotransferase [Thioalkalivibrio sp. ALJ9]